MRHAKFALAFIFPFLLASCSKSSSPQPTSLQITVINSVGNPVIGASVTLYSSQTDLLNNTNALGSSTSDSKGMVTFSNLSAIQYYWLAQDGCENNVNSSVTSQTPLTANINNTVTSTLSGTGTLKFVNTSANPYHVYVNGVLSGDISGGQSGDEYYAPIGNYTIRVVQISGYAVTPTDESFTGTLSCGSSLTTTFP